jgi:hypothetical protein
MCRLNKEPSDGPTAAMMALEAMAILCNPDVALDGGARLEKRRSVGQPRTPAIKKTVNRMPYSIVREASKESASKRLCATRAWLDGWRIAVQWFSQEPQP